MEPYKPFRVFASISTSIEPCKIRQPPDWNRERLSDATAHLIDIPLKDMDRWVNRSTSERRRQAEKKGKIVHPMNCFMLYQRAYSERVRVLLAATESGSIPQISISRVTGASWKNESGHIRQKYEALARIDRQNHGAAFPDYNSRLRRPHAAILNGNESRSLMSLHGGLEHQNDINTHLNSEPIPDQSSLSLEVENGLLDSPGASQSELLLPGTYFPLDQRWRNYELTDLPLNDTITPTLRSVAQEEIIPPEASPIDAFRLGSCRHLPTQNAGSVWHTIQHEYRPCGSLTPLVNRRQRYSMQSTSSASHSFLPMEQMKGYKGDEREHLIGCIKQSQPEMALLEDFDPIMPNVFSDILPSSPKSNSEPFMNTPTESCNKKDDSEEPGLLKECTEETIDQVSSSSETAETTLTRRTLENSIKIDYAALGSGKRPFKCGEPGCKWRFKRRGHLTRHLKTHEGTSVLCLVPECNRSFTRNDNLQAHIRTHTKKGGRNLYVPALDKDSPFFDPTFNGR